MKIISITWNGHYNDIYDGSGGKVGTRYVTNTCNVTKANYGYEPKDICKEIIEESPTIYLIKFHYGKMLRIFNPIEVLFEE